jgi:hypothetical protein
MESNEEKITDINNKIDKHALKLINDTKECNSWTYSYSQSIVNYTSILKQTERIISLYKEAIELEKPKYKEGAYYWVKIGEKWKIAQRDCGVWCFAGYATYGVDEVGEEITRN